MAKHTVGKKLLIKNLSKQQQKDLWKNHILGSIEVIKIKKKTKLFSNKLEYFQTMLNDFTVNYNSISNNWAETERFTKEQFMSAAALMFTSSNPIERYVAEEISCMLKED